MKNKLICLVLYSLPIGGVEKCFLALAQDFVSRGLQVDIVLGTTTNTGLEHKIPKGCKLHIVSKNSKLLFPIGLLLYIAKRKPTHIISAFNDVNFITIFATRLSRLKINTTVTHHTPISQPKYKKTTIKRANDYLATPMMKWYLPRSDNVIAVSKGLASEISQNTGFPHIKIHVIYNPIITDEARLYSLRRLNEKSHPARNKKFSIIFIGRLSQEKRIDVLIGAFNILHKEIDTKLTIIGDGPLRSDLELEASKSNGHIIFWGAMENPYQLLRKSDVLVLPSDFEGFGNVLVEAMSCGVQVIATDCPYGPREILDSGTLGQLIKCGDADDLAAALKNTYNREYWIQPKSLIKKSLTFTTKNSAEEYLYHMKIK